MIEPIMERMLTIKEVADLLQVSRAVINKWVKAEKLQFYRVGEKSLRFRQSDIIDFVNKGRLTPFRLRKKWDTLKYH